MCQPAQCADDNEILIRSYDLVQGLILDGDKAFD